ncbi:nucleoside hydrolase [Streptomyces sp. NBS 14/10]|uniref:nucleoside hydrolase n=1 Tax=Streptomyces sp. NBS 14/10 TaxID=1945643 RepID=UPI00211B4477|nr:nucleoside hydrolase [Streptomyces sp. NBS 14/10]KAK1183352.1 nucleoside hydrolase [Streptomyces sp. NBS 14/10]
MSQAPRRVMIDCDPGIDDAIALFLAYASPELEVAGVTTVAGNVGLDQVVDNALRLCDLIGGPAAATPVLRGHAGPLARVPRHPDEPVHGAYGLGGVELPAAARAAHPGHAVDWMAEQLRGADPGEITLIATAPLTNVAALLHIHPDTRALLREIVVMGGAAFAPGNTTPAAEFNFHADPEAARYVTESGVPLRIVGLDVTRKALTPLADADALVADGAPVTTAAGQMLRHLIDRYARRHRVRACAVHDALAVAAAVRPELLEWTEAWVTVECAGEFTRGALVADVHGRTGLAPNARVATGVDAEAFRAFLMSRLCGHYGAATTPAP